MILIECNKIYCEIVTDVENEALKLHDYIGDAVQYFVEALDEHRFEMSKYMRKFLRQLRASGCKNEIDFKPKQKKLQKLMNVVASIADTLLEKSDPTIEQKHSVLLLALIFWWVHVAAQGINSNVRDVQVRNNCTASENSKLLSSVFSDALVSLDKSIPVETRLIVDCFKEFLTAFIKITTTLNTVVQDAQDFLDSPKKVASTGQANILTKLALN